MRSRVWWMVLSFLVMSVGSSGAQPAYLLQWGSYGSGNGQFWNPEGIAVDPAGNVYVVDVYNQRVQKFTNEGGYVTQWTSPGEAFHFSSGIAADAAGNVYVSDYYRIQKFTSNGGFVTRWGTWGTGPGQFLMANQIACTANGTVFACDSGARRIQKFSTSGSVLGGWGNSGGAPAQLLDPYGIAVDAAGNHVFVIDRDFAAATARVVHYSGDGVYLGEFGATGGGSGEWQQPLAIAWDPSGLVVVTDLALKRVQQYTPSGVFVAEWGAEGSDDGQFLYPIGVAVDANGNVFVCDADNSRVQKFGHAAVPASTTSWGRMKETYRR